MRTARICCLPAFALGLSVVVAAPAAVIEKAVNLDALNLGTSWVGGVVPGPADFVIWHEPTADETLSIGGPLSIRGLDVSMLAGKGSLILNGSDALTLGDRGLAAADNNSKVGYQFYCPVSIGADQTWTNPVKYGAISLYGGLDVHTNRLTLVNTPEVRYRSPVAGTGTIVVRGPSTFYDGAAAPDTTFLVDGNGSLSFKEVPAKNGAPRAANVLIAGTSAGTGARLIVNGRKNENAYDVISGELANLPGYGDVTLSPNSTRHATIDAGSYRFDKGLLLFCGTNLGTTPAADLVANASSILFDTAPELIGGGGAAGTPSISILPWAFYGSSTSDRFTSLVTYDDTYGIRGLDLDTEFLAALPAGDGPVSNVRLTNPGEGTSVTYTLSDGLTTVNSLVLHPLGTAKSSGGVVVEGSGASAATLRVLSGLVFGRQLQTDVTAVDANILQGFTLDFAGHAGAIVSQQTKQSNMNSAAPLTISTPIVNDGGEGVYFYSTAENRGLIYLNGSAASTYTGPTRVMNGNVRIQGDTNAGIPGDLEVWGGNCIHGSDLIPDDADIRIYGGSLLQKGGASNSGSGASETFRDLLMEGGSFTSGASGTSAGATTMRDATLLGGSWTVCRGHKPTMQHLALAGGTVTINPDENSSRTTIVTIEDGISITNTPSGTYAPITFSPGESASKIGGLMKLSGGITFEGNADNTNATTIANAAPAAGSQWAHIQFNGLQTFDIGDGAADIDLLVEPWLQDLGATAGGIRKTGAGTLALVHTNNAYTAGTFVDAGRLVADGALAGDVSVAAGATFQGGLLGDTGMLAIGGSLALAGGARLGAAFTASTNTIATVAGAVTGAGTTYVDISYDPDTVDFTGGRCFLRARSVAGSFRASDPKLSIAVRSRGTELWVDYLHGTLILMR